MKEQPKSKVRKKDFSLSTDAARLSINKTYKLFIGGQFPRTESGRYIPVTLQDGSTINTCWASRKDFRNSVVAARSAFKNWASRSAYNRSQILYRIAEMLEGRRSQFVDDLRQAGWLEDAAVQEVNDSIDCVVYYAGWCDKFSQIFSSVNPVSTHHFNFSVPEPMGVVGLVGQEWGLYSLVLRLMPVIAGANTCVVLVGTEATTWALDFAEVLVTSDLPPGVINILTGPLSELLLQFGSHMDINSLIYAGSSSEEITQLQELASTHVLRLIIHKGERVPPGPYQIMDTQEIKTTWHPVGK